MTREIFPLYWRCHRLSLMTFLLCATFALQVAGRNISIFFLSSSGIQTLPLRHVCVVIVVAIIVSSLHSSMAEVEMIDAGLLASTQKKYLAIVLAIGLILVAGLEALYSYDSARWYACIYIISASCGLFFLAFFGNRTTAPLAVVIPFYCFITTERHWWNIYTPDPALGHYLLYAIMLLLSSFLYFRSVGDNRRLSK